MRSHSSLPTIFIAEDDPNDLFLLKRALAEAGISNPVVAFGNGIEAIEFLKRLSAADAASIIPGLLLLDLHLPQIDGCSVIAWIRKQPALRGLRIVVLSGSGDSREVRNASALGADALWEKPASPAALASEAARLNQVPAPVSAPGANATR